MVNTSLELKAPVYQHMIPVLVRETSRVLGFVPTAYTKFLSAGKYILWQDGFEVMLDCVTQPILPSKHNGKLIQFLAVVYNQTEINRRFNLKGFISADSKQRQYQSEWACIKSGAYQVHDFGPFDVFNTGMFDTSAEYERAHKPNEGFVQDESQMPCVNLCWNLSLSLDRFANQYDYIETDWLALFHKSLARKKLDDDTPKFVEIIQPIETVSLKAQLLNQIIEAGSSDKLPNNTLPCTLQIMRLRDLQVGVYKFVMKAVSGTKVYNINISLVIKDSKKS